MARKLSLASLSWRRVIRIAGPPSGTIFLSVAILSTAMWIRGREQVAKLDISAFSPAVSPTRTSAPGDSNQTVTVPRTHVTSSSGKTSHSKSTTTTPGSHDTQTTSGSHGGGTSTKKPATSSTGSTNVGFTPVTGGSVASVKSGNLPAGTALSSIVTELGTHPTTTWNAHTISGPGGVSLTIPQSMSPTSMLVLPLQHGVLWMQVPLTQIGPTGTLGPAMSSTTLWYTSYPATGSQPLTTGAESLGVLPAASGNSGAIQNASPNNTNFSVSPPPSFWYAPSTSGSTGNGTVSGNSTTVTGTTASGTQTNSTRSVPNTTSTGSANSSGTSGTSGSQGASTGSSGTSAAPGASGGASGGASSSTGTGVTNGSMSASSAAAYLYPSGLYQTANGAVIALEAISSSATTTTATWLYQWNEATQQLIPIVSLWSGSGTYAWFAVGTNVVYFGSRSVIPPSATRFVGHQYLYDTSVQKLTPIRLGTWTSDAYADGNQLIFDERNSTTWASFTPSGQP